jgi:hypothetical protein
MARQSNAALSITTGKEDIPYADKHELARGLLRHSAEAINIGAPGAGGAGFVAIVPFEPAGWLIQRTTVPLLQKHFPGKDDDVNMLTGANAAVTPVVAAVGDGTWSITIVTALAPDAVDVNVEAYAYADQGGGS